MTMSAPDDGRAAVIDSLFGDEDDEVDGVVEDSSASVQRPAENGVLQFHSGTEEMLWLQVERANPRTRSELLSVVDAFCYQRHWMMHCGPEKGHVLEQFLLDHVQNYSPLDGSTYQIVEFGTYCGYSLIRMANALLSKGIDHFHIHTIDIVEPTVARRMVQHAVEQNETVEPPTWKVSFLTRSLDTTSQIQDLVNFPIDFLFLDHDKDAYLSDLKALEAAKCIRQGTAVAADNVVVFGLKAYRSHLQNHPCVTTRLMEHALEYAEDEAERYPDGMELSTYVKNPV